MYRVEFSEYADQDMIDISSYIYDVSGSADIAIRIVVDLTNKIKERLSRFPNSGLVAFISNADVVYRQLVIEHYCVIYRI